MLVCGIDIGTTNLKVSIVDETGVVRWTYAVPTPREPLSYGSGVNATRLVDLIEDLIVAGWRTTGSDVPLSAIATTGVGEDGMCVGRGLEPLDAAIPWYDPCAIAEASEIRAGASATTRAGIRMDHTRTGAKWLWLRRNRPSVFTDQSCWIALTDYPSVYWTGRPFISETLASRTGCYDIGKRQWIDALLNDCGAPNLPDVLRAGEIVGTMRAGALIRSGAAGANTLVVAGGHDHPVAATVIQRIDQAARVDSIGTANVVYGESPHFSFDRFDRYLAFMAPVQAKIGVACLGVFEFSSAVQSLQARGIDMRAFLALPRIPGEPGFFTAETIAAGADPRAVLEMAGITARRMYDEMRDVGVADGDVYATGGWSRSRSLLELRASIFGHPVYVLSVEEPAVVGAALLAAEGLGSAVDFTAGVTQTTVDPDRQWVDFYGEQYQAFLDCVDADVR